LDGPTVLRVLLPCQVRHAQVAGRPVSNVAVWGDDLEYLDQPVAGQPHLGPRGGNLRSAQRPFPLTVAVDQPIGLQVRQPCPTGGTLERLVQPHEATNKKDEADKFRKQLEERNAVQKKPKL